MCSKPYVPVSRQTPLGPALVLTVKRCPFMRGAVCVCVMPRLCVPLQDIINSVVSENSYTPLTDVFFWFKYLPLHSENPSICHTFLSTLALETLSHP